MNKNIFHILFFIVIVMVCSCNKMDDPENTIVIGSKKFTESVILGEITSQYLSTDFSTIHQRQLGGSRILWNALLKGDIDVYPEYTGTLIEELLKNENVKSLDQLNIVLERNGIKATKNIGFNNTYGIGVRIDIAEKYKLKNISDLVKYPELLFGLTNEFIDRGDGWQNLSLEYNLKHDAVGMDHDLAYKALQSGKIDVMDVYTTDAEISQYNIVVLKDDKKFFSVYNAIILYRISLLEKYLHLKAKLNGLTNSIDEIKMIDLNSRVKFNGLSEGVVAAAFLNENFGLNINVNEETFINRLTKTILEHIYLVSISMFFAILFSIPLGIASSKNKLLGKIILSTTGIIQTIPSLALLVLMIPMFGIGNLPSIVALFLYSLLPIVRNTYLGITNIPASLIDSAKVLGLKESTILFKIKIPLALSSILSGVKTSSIINVGTATLGALIGAGGLGQPILTGIRLDNISLIMEGAIPAAVLALLVQLVFDVIEKLTVSKGLK